MNPIIEAINQINLTATRGIIMAGALAGMWVTINAVMMFVRKPRIFKETGHGQQ